MHLVLLDAEYEVRRFPFATETPAFLLPVVQRTLLQRTLDALSRHRLGRPTLVTSREPAEDMDLARAVVEHDLRVVPTLGEALHLTAREQGEAPMLLAQANLHPFPDLSALVSEHISKRRALSWVRGSCWWGPGQYTFGPPATMIAAPIFTRIIQRLDIERPMMDLPRIAKEKGLPAGAVDSDQPIVEVNNAWSLYQVNLGTLATWRDDLFQRGFRPVRPNLWAHPSAVLGQIDHDPRSGLIVVGRGARIEDGTALLGPSIIGERAFIEGRSCIHRGLLLEQCHLGQDSYITRQIVSPRISERVAA